MLTQPIRVGYAMTGSFCTFAKSMRELEKLAKKGYDLTPIMSFHASSIDTRFGKADDFMMQAENLCGKPVIRTIQDAEPIGPKKMFDIIVVAPCTSNTLAKLALGVTDTPVTMAVKSHIRNQRPVVIAAATNDALAAAAKNIGLLENLRNYYFVPLQQDDYVSKPYSMVAVFDKLEETMLLALKGQQIQPMMLGFQEK